MYFFQFMLLKHNLIHLFLAIILIFTNSLIFSAHAAEAGKQLNVDSSPIPISIVIDDMGYNKKLGQQAIHLPGNIAYSFLPATPHAYELAEQVYAQGKRVLLHLPMQGRVSLHNHEPNSLNKDMPESIFKATLNQHLAAIPHISGVNNHMGSHLTPLIMQMDWLMNELAEQELFFIDSRTTHLTVTAQSAAAHHVLFAERDIFLDNIKAEESITNAFNKFLRKAKKHNGAIAIAHPHPITLSVLEKLINQLPAQNYELVDITNFLSKDINTTSHQLVKKSLD